MYDLYVIGTDGEWVHFGKITLKNWCWVKEHLPWFAAKADILGVY